MLDVNGESVENWDEVNFALTTSPGRPVILGLQRDGQRLDLEVTPKVLPKYEIGDAGLFAQYLPRVVQVLDDSPAEAAGFRIGDEIRTADGKAISGSPDFIDVIQESPGRKVEVMVLRNDVETYLTVVPDGPAGEAKIGVGLGVLQRYGPAKAVVESVKYNIDIARQTFAVLGKIFTGQLGARSISGPIEIAAMSGQAARTGFSNLIFLMGLISISIAILNLMPIPMLDGGQIFVLLIESARQRDLSLVVKERIQQVGFYMIIMLMVVVLYFDLVKNLPEGLLPGS